MRGPPVRDGTEAVDWEEYYSEGDWERDAGVAGVEAMTAMADRFLAFAEPAEFASVGCGPAAVLFGLAESHPDVDFFGFDISETVVAANRDHAADLGLDNVHFEVDSLPELATDRKFDVVYSIGTLFFVREGERALEDLYEHVSNGGYLVVNYPNRYLHYEVVNELDEDGQSKIPLVRDRENLLTFDRVGEILGTKPRSYYNLVDGEEHREVQWPIVVLQK